MNSEKNQDTPHAGLLDGIQNEVSAENAPLLRFITSHAALIGGCVFAILLVLGGFAIWNWQHGAKQEEARAELARINSQLKDRDRLEALNKLAEKAPDSVKLFIYMSLGQNVQEAGDPVLAADAYAKAAKLDRDGPLGLTAALGSVSSLLMQAEYNQALALLQELEKQLPAASKSQELEQMLAEAAFHAGKLELARKTYQELGDRVTTPEGAYFLSRAEAIAAQINSSQKAPDGVEEKTR